MSSRAATKMSPRTALVFLIVCVCYVSCAPVPAAKIHAESVASDVPRLEVVEVTSDGTALQLDTTTAVSNIQSYKVKESQPQRNEFVKFPIVVEVDLELANKQGL
ncbi:hypothetical protein LOTGIDRAFT_234863 [Lottia gigantea]|uniref:Uncharacterized protein n=1 Tax=Lottia gigantea TaxID=225164 RepID=V4A3R6_LOTGI|nr:hypothetical protein LOTGIDRAFT_234863 [Lottia gigantea]ESO87856.1 hypothetical protein LOTGIDRAFT_234863 [Lottia gigantea]